MPTPSQSKLQTLLDIEGFGDLGEVFEAWPYSEVSDASQTRQAAQSPGGLQDVQAVEGERIPQ